MRPGPCGIGTGLDRISDWANHRSIHLHGEEETPQQQATAMSPYCVIVLLLCLYYPVLQPEGTKGKQGEAHSFPIAHYLYNNSML